MVTTRIQQKRRQMMHLVQPYLPQLLLCLRCTVLVIICAVSVHLLQIVTDAGSSVTPWKLFSRDQETQGKTRENVGVSQNDQEIEMSDPLYPRISDMLNEHIYFSFYDGHRVYTNQDSVGGGVSRKPRHNEQEMLYQVHGEAVKYLNKKYPDRYKPEHCNSIRYRTVPTVGLEVDVTCRNGVEEVDRVTLVKEFSRSRVVYHHDHPHTTINLIMPLQGRYTTLQIFMENLINILESDPLQMSLTLVYFKDDLHQKVQELLKKVESQVPNLRTQFILLENKEFSRGLGLQIGVEETKLKGEVLFFCDVDAFFTRTFLTRCQTTPVQNHQVYIPMVFSLYNPEFIYPLHKRSIPPPLEQLLVYDNYGYWRIWGYGMVCVYKSDFLHVGNFNKYRRGWGGEDLLLLQKIARSRNYKVIRSLDPGLFHLYHPKSCRSTDRFYSCTKTKALNEASKASLGLWYFKTNTENVSVFGVLAEGHDPPTTHWHHEDEAEDEARQHKHILLIVLLSFVLADVFVMFYSYKIEVKYYC
ncbi:chondroitin sulfate N-acetylgalactosaminyltransferase 2-like [Homarus americanus]|uniref:chondroitin sulfate N-acetylgalactosaminyltransferase 2-like n=1 Tax=Homarus americanus TaxID=6706 RepID=UPI001C444985|nr:chondroitin sulfate N-acetylgalactosaminyltransferase 2-like [Homarus americanus]